MVRRGSSGVTTPSRLPDNERGMTKEELFLAKQEKIKTVIELHGSLRGPFPAFGSPPVDLTIHSPVVQSWWHGWILSRETTRDWERRSRLSGLHTRRLQTPPRCPHEAPPPHPPRHYGPLLTAAAAGGGGGGDIGCAFLDLEKEEKKRNVVLQEERTKRGDDQRIRPFAVCKDLRRRRKRSPPLKMGGGSLWGDGVHVMEENEALSRGSNTDCGSVAGHNVNIHI